MECPKCKHDRLIVARTYRYPDYDLREVYCEDCYQHYYTKTELTNDLQFIKRVINPNNYRDRKKLEKSDDQRRAGNSDISTDYP